ncbi:PAC2 family protein [Mycobacterium xenopi 4042]|uniref:PAC2 family protein n=1 Tax=Mycobacterium xenopi 4042 TaxID=1299334 RepID=X8BF29_MYCXE|nr:PAC2 family protein [Mycobacterium xenopi 4042]
MTPPDASAALPELHNTVVVAAFEGWNDAGDAASDAVEHLEAIWEAEPIVEIDDEAYYDYQVNRPVIRQVDGVTRELVWPAMRISHCRPPGSDRDIVLMHGVEPNMRWRTFCAELLAIVDKLNVETVVILGALLADTPHSRPVRCPGGLLTGVGAPLRFRGNPLRRPDRHCRSVSGRLCGRWDSGGDVLGGGPALRVSATEPEGHGGAAAPGRGRARHRGAAG